MDSNISLLLEAGISSAMFDIDPGDEVNHPAQQFLNSADGSQSMSVDESPNFGSLGADNVLGSPPLLPLQDEVDVVEEGVLSDSEAASIARSATGSASAAAPLPQQPRSVKVPAVRVPTVTATAASATSDTTCRDISTRQRSDSEAMRKSTAMLREQWMSRYHELIEWKRKHGNCNVPQREKKLGCWVSTQRTQYKLLLEGRQSQMNQERIDLLTNLDFDWDPRGIFKRVRKGSVGEESAGTTAAAKADRNDRKWMIWYDQLIKFKEKHGHCVVTRKQDNSLGIWVQKQRKFFRERQAGKTSNILTSDKVDLLNSIGFAWDVSSGTKSVKSATSVRSEQQKAEDWVTEGTQDDRGVDDDHWDQMFFELSQYRVINGHTNVQPWPTEPRVCELLAWCNIQRHNYANLWSGKGRYSPITEIQIRQLNQLGFDWTIPSANGNVQEGDGEWAAMLELLRQFKQRHEHTNVPRNLGELGTWVDAQRIALKNMLEGAPAHPGQPRMTFERFSRLEALGFEFSIRGSLSSDGEAQKISRKSQ